MKTAREIIADSPKLVDACRKHASALSPIVTAEDIIAALAAEGFSIVETGRDPVKDLAFHVSQLRHAYTHLKANRVSDQPGLADGLISPAIAAFERALSRSTREGKTE